MANQTRLRAAALLAALGAAGAVGAQEAAKPAVEPKPAVSAPSAELAERVGAVLKTPGYEHGRWGLLVVDAETGQPLYERQPDGLFRPASVTKLFSTAAALAAFGADHRFVTPVVHTGELDKDDGVLDGDLILVAQGDPVLGGRTGPDGSLLFADTDHIYAGPRSRSTLVNADPLGGLDQLAREVAAAGVKTIRGDVLIDDRLFDEAASSGSGPRKVTPIVVNDNLIDVVVTPGPSAGEPATVRLVPETSFASFDARVETVEAGASKHVTVEPAGPRRFVVRGRVPAGSSPSSHTYEVEEPADYARALLIESLRRRGVKLDASPLDDNRREALPTPERVADLPKLAQYTSPPLSEYLKVTLKVSHNLHASTLPLLLAVREGHRTLDDGLEIQGELLKELGVDLGAISFGGGAGGSPADLVTPRATVDLLRAMADRTDFPAYQGALPIIGRDGTLAQAVGEMSPARGHVRAKTGTYYVRDGLTGKYILTSKALAGYMETATGRRLIFAFFLNDVPLDPEVEIQDATAAAGRLLGRLCEVFYADAAPSPTATRPPAAEARPAAEPAAPGASRPSGVPPSGQPVKP